MTNLKREFMIKSMDGNYSEGGVIYDKKEYSPGHG